MRRSTQDKTGSEKLGVQSNAKGGDVLYPFTPRRLDITMLPYAYFIMGVNQWRHLDDPVHQLRQEASMARAAQAAAARNGEEPKMESPYDPSGGVFGTPREIGPQVYTKDLKDPKKPSISPLKVREADLCYRQVKKPPIPICPPGFTPNKEGACHMLVAPELTCYSVRHMIVEF